MLIWPIFSRSRIEKPVNMPAARERSTSGSQHWEIQLAWSEYQYGHWTAKCISDPVRLDGVSGRPDILFGDYCGRQARMRGSRSRR